MNIENNILIAFILITAFVSGIVFFVLGFISLVKFLLSIKNRDIDNSLKENLVLFISPLFMLFDGRLNINQKEFSKQVKVRFIIVILSVFVFLLAKHALT